MSRLYDNVEPAVIDEILLTDAVQSQCQKGLAGEIAKHEGIAFDTVQSLRLDYRNILKIDNLWAFKMLVKLQLDNNIIEKIENLDHLVHLRWLDLSFNNIEKIEGLDNLVNLEDLSLYHNQIEKIENLDKLKRLQILSLGNNHVCNLSDIVYLRKFPLLKSICLKGNPMAEMLDYLTYVHAILPNLVYVDYRRTDKQLKEEAYKKFQTEVDELNLDEQAAEKAEQERLIMVERENLHRRAFVLGMDDENIFQQLFEKDPEGRELLTIPELYNSIECFSENLTAKCKAVFDYGMAELTRRETEVQSFWTSIGKAKEQNAEKSRSQIIAFKEYKAELFKDLLSTTDSVRAEDDIMDFNEHVQKLWQDLMSNEMDLVEQLDEVIKEFELNLNDIIQRFIENVEGYFTECRELQTQFHERLMDICPAILERFSRADSQTDASDALINIFIDKDSMANALAASNDAHLVKIDDWADRIRDQAAIWVKEVLNQVNESEKYARNRARVMEINRMIDALKEEVENLDIHAFAEN